jgi:hypothetical protein
MQKYFQISKLCSLDFRLLSWTSDAILKLVWNKPDRKTSLKQKTERKNVQNSLSYGRKTNFSAIYKFAAILKTCEKNSFSKNLSSQSGSLCRKVILPILFDRTPFDRNTIWPKTIWPKGHLTEYRLTKCRLTETPFDRFAVWPNAVWPKVHFTEKSHLTENKIYQKVVWPKIKFVKWSARRLAATKSWARILF